MDHFVAVQGFCYHTEDAEIDPQMFANWRWQFELAQRVVESDRALEAHDWLTARNVAGYEAVVLIDRAKVLTGAGSPVLVMWGEAGFRFADPKMAMMFKLTFGGA